MAPRLVVCGKALSKTGGHADNRPRHDTYDATRWMRNFGAIGRIADGVDEVRRACRQELRQGARFIKIMANGGVSSPTDPIAWQGYSVSEMTAAVEEARDAETYVSAHLYRGELRTLGVPRWGQRAHGGVVVPIDDGRTEGPRERSMATCCRVSLFLSAPTFVAEDVRV